MTNSRSDSHSPSLRLQASALKLPGTASLQREPRPAVGVEPDPPAPPLKSTPIRLNSIEFDDILNTTRTLEISHFSTLALPRAAFTLIELLMVVMVISILVAMLLTAIRAVERHTLETITKAEIRNIETAWKQYFSHYQMWPTNSLTSIRDQASPYLMDEKLADALSGQRIDRQKDGFADIDTLNPDRITFMEFSRLGEADGELIPINAWGESGRYKTVKCAYYVYFDQDGLGRAEFTPGEGYSNTNILRGVAVWSFNPAKLDRSMKPKLLSNWDN